MSALLKKIRTPTFIFFSCVLVLSVIVTILSKPYFTERIFYVDNYKYSFYSDQDNVVTYRSKTNDPIQVKLDHEKRTVTIQHQEYFITKINSSPSPNYKVIYPNGHKYEVHDASGILLTSDGHGNYVSEASTFVNNQRMPQDGEEQYSPSTLVTAAYPEYHVTRGAPALLYLALAVLIYGWCSFRYRKFQDILFFLSLRWIWVNDPEPSDFYYFMSKVSGIIVMIGSLWIAVQAF
ncbi:hypothetical protein [Paenibacillus agri]|uniref:DUF6199 domain-containing protein n=1 Tax=Paenibacillus agri TaxID=2744309 RepID=A0A850ED27_9BACL|nr:hypothetical protein [Paenibacillus agri]NUU59153.1 hypothetical protein [Paenibacillus agri]